MQQLWPEIPPEFVEELCFHLGYRYHGGSGLGWSRADVLDCPFDMAQRMSERLAETRKKEAAALRSAMRSK